MAIPKPNKARIKLLHAGYNHISEYTGTSLGRVSYGTKRIWDLTYTWTQLNRPKAQDLYGALYSLGTGQGTIPLYFQTKANHIQHSEKVGDVLRSQAGASLVFETGTMARFNLEPLDKLQVGYYCLEVVRAVNDVVVVANMPMEILTKVDDEDVVRNFDFSIVGQNLSEDIGYEIQGIRGNHVFEPEVVNFREVVV